MGELFAAVKIDRTRLAGIWGRWPRYRWDHLGRSRWEGWSTERYLGFGIVGTLVAATFLELALVSGKGEPLTFLSELGLTPSGRAILLLLTAINAWILDRWISSHTRGDRHLSVWLRALRPLTAGVPIIGLAFVPAWRWIAQVHPAWAFWRKPEAGLQLLRPSPPRRLEVLAEQWIRRRGQHLPWFILWVIACQISPLLSGVSWLAGNGPLGPSRKAMLLGACATLHLGAALCGAFYGRNRADSSAFRLRILPWFLLLPGLGILSLAVMHPASFHPREESLMQVVHDRQRVRDMPMDARLDSVRRTGDAELHRLAFFRMKALFLALDAAALAWLTARLAGWSLGLYLTRFQSGVILLVLPALPGLLLAVTAMAARLTGSWPVLRELEKHPYGRYLALVPVTCLSGLVTGSLLAYGCISSAGLFLTAVGFSALLLLVVLMPLSALAGSPVQSDPTGALWFVLWFELTILGAVLGLQPEPGLVRSLETAFLFAPVWSLGLFLALGPWLLRPFTLRSLADRRLPRRDRAVLAAVAFTAALPLGGLFIPFWIYAHHRLWPGMERSWAAARTMIEDNTSRAEEVHRRWRRTSLDVMGRSSWGGWTPEDATFIVSLVSVAVLLLLEPALWFRDWPPSFIGDRVLDWLAPSFLVMPLHGWLLDRFLSAKTSAERAMPRWLLVVRFVAGSFPLFSFALLPAWRLLLERRPPWAFQGHRPGPSLCLSHSPSRSRSSGRLLHLYTSGIFAVFMGLGFALPMLWAAWLARRARPPVIVAVCALLHFVAFITSRSQAARLHQTWSGPLPSVLPWLAFLPFPGPMASALVPVILQTGGSTNTLIWSAWAQRSSADRLPLWRQFQDTLRTRRRAAPWFQQWRRPRLHDRPIRAGELDRDLLSFYRLKTALLLLEGGALVAGLAILVERFPRLGSTVDATLHFATFFAVALGGIGLIIWTGAVIARFLRLSGLAKSDLLIFGRYLLLTPLAFLAGSQVGFAWVAGRQAELGLLIGYGGALLAVLAWLFFFPSSVKSHDLGTSAFWSFAFLAIALIGIPIGLNARLGGWPTRILGGTALLAPAWSLLLFRRFGHWLARPFLWRDLLDPKLSSRVRASLAFLKWTAVLPGAGLAIPAWIALRSFLEKEFRQER
ncbi:MAG: hypothetical protein QOH06_2491 [Acidobacteriota bacterium]|nr:hypothetical protein [Acidobacteriota bacterium]